MSKHIKKGDKVKVITGNSKGIIGKVIIFNRKKNQVKVEKANIKTHFNKNTKEGITKKEGWIDASNIMFIEGETITKLYKKDGCRFSKKTNNKIEGEEN